jgi:tetratricopeptide (TPR) repeat protein
MQVEAAAPPLSPEEQLAERKAKSEVARADGNAHFKAGRWAESAAQYQLAMAADPNNATHPCNRAAALLHSGKAAEALANAQAALALDPNLLKAHVRAAKALCQLGRLSEARRQLETASALEGSASIGGELATLDGLEALLRNGKAALSRPDPSAAREAAVTLSSLAEKCPASVEFACLQMEAVLRARPGQGAAQVLAESARWLRANTDNPDLLVVRGKALYGTGQLEQVRVEGGG